MLQQAFKLCRAGGVDAADVGLIFVAEYRLSAGGTVGFDAVGLRIVLPLVVGSRTDYLRYDVAGALDDDAVAGTDIFAVDVFFVV